MFTELTVFVARGVGWVVQVWEDPAGAWENPANPGQWLFIGQTTVGTGVLLTTWASREGSNWTAGFDYVGSFFPGTGDARCPGTASLPSHSFLPLDSRVRLESTHCGPCRSAGAGCGGCCPSFANGRTFSSNTSASHLLYTCSNQYWLGSYQPSTGSSSTGAQAFVPGGVPQTFDAGGQAMASKGFWAPDGRYLHFTWVIGTDDHAVASRRNPGSAGTWDSMLSVPRELTVDEELDTAILTPAQEVTALRSELLYSNASTTPIPRGVFPLPGAHGDALDIEVNFTWEGNVAAGSVAGVQVLTGPGEATTVYTLAPTLASATLVANLTDASTFRPIPMDPYMPGMDLSGGDYNSTRVPPNSDPHDCQRRCEADPNCAAWTQVIRGEPVGAADCIKKGPNHLPPSPLAQCTSGCVRNCNRTAFGPQDPIIMSNFSLRVAEVGVDLPLSLPRAFSRLALILLTCTGVMTPPHAIRDLLSYSVK